jgi:hypothetical protein
MEIWDLRIRFSDNIQRIFYFAPKEKKREFILLPGYVKISEKTLPSMESKLQISAMMP